MVVRAVLVTWLVGLAASASAQQLTLSVFDFSWRGKEFSLSNEVVADSTATIVDGVSFHPTDSLLYYSRRTGSRWQIVAFNFSSGTQTVVIESDELLSDPKITPDKKHLSCVAGPKRELRKLSLTSRQWGIVFGDTPVDRYVWMDDNALLIISPGDPNQLQLVTLRPKKVIPIAQHVGRELQQSRESIAFVHKLSVDSWSIKRINSDGSIKIVAETLPEADLFTLAPGGRVLLLSEDHIFGYSPATQWLQFQVENTRRQGSIKSIGTNPSGDKLFVLFATP